jgi:magnesium transporter
VLWIDLYDPTPEKERSMEALLGLQVPNRQELAEIEGSTRLYQEHGTLA